MQGSWRWPRRRCLPSTSTPDQKTLEKLPGIGPAKAQAIIEHRPYKSKEDLKKVDGIGDKTYKMLESEITVGGGAKAAK